ncbi:MAG: leucine zipper domain-containing protein [Candidatus Didemnitutus sp.]|nr:leucine zipper domain-containing protein [Candidatus Didemnitutus sp.]
MHQSGWHGRFTLTELCADFRVSRKTGYKWLRRYQQEGVRGLQCRSRRPRHCPHHTAEEIGPSDRGQAIGSGFVVCS